MPNIIRPREIYWRHSSFVDFILHYDNGIYSEAFNNMNSNLKQMFSDLCHASNPSSLDDVVAILNQVLEFQSQSQPSQPIPISQGIEELVQTQIFEYDYDRITHHMVQDVESLNHIVQDTNERERGLRDRQNQHNEERRQKQIEEQRSEQKMLEAILDENFPKPNFSEWSSSKELSKVQRDWLGNIQYRVNWIFDRREREGFNRRNIEYFSIEDIEAKLRKRKTGTHELDNELSKFYDWHLGGTDWILRLEYLTINDSPFLIVRSIHKPSNKEVLYEIRNWDEGRFKQLSQIWSSGDLDEDNTNLDRFLNGMRERLDDLEYEEDEDVEFDDED